MAAENYHLKWDSHLSYLNSSVATLYKNEKFADVVLYSSSSSSASGSGTESSIPTVGISAHKFILSSCSQFFATMFETAPICSPNGVLYVVLPPELSHRAIQILVQYMYSGEATVANDILNEVLRGGEILKIRGLCRTSSSSSNSHNASTRVNEALIANGVGTHYIQSAGNRQQSLPTLTHSHMSNAHGGDMYIVNKCPNGAGGGNCGQRYHAMEHLQQPVTQSVPTQQTHAQQIQQTHHQFRGLGVSVLPKDSPVIVKSPKLSQLGLLSAAASSSKHLTGCGITVNKEVAIDPDEKCCYRLNQLQVETSLCNEIGCTGGCPMSMENEQVRRRQRSQNDENMRATVVEQQLEREYTERQCPPPVEEEQHDAIDMPNYERQLRRSSGGSTGERMRDYFVSDSYEHTNTTSTKSHYTEQVSGSRLSNISPMPHTQTFLAIKQEPTDWTTNASATDNAHADLALRPKTPQRSPKQPLDFKMPPGSTTVKLEVGAHSHSPHSEQDTNTQDDSDYETRLACETCKQSFDEPKSWVRHLESHTVNTAATTAADTVTVNVACGTTNNMNSTSVGNTITNGGEALVKSYVPKKRRRGSQENNAGHVTLCCDLCSISFETPADWVRHLNNEHTEIELAMFNSKKDNEQKSSGNNNHQNLQQLHLKRYTHRSTYDQPANETQPLAVTSTAPSTSNFSERTEACNKKFSTHSGVLTHKRNHNSALNGVSVSVSTSVASTSSGGADVSVISSVASSLPNEQISTSSQA
uniref:Protein bric-a-brac 2 n=1 Tax=Bactrocera latifrons TaxID=174628 RepID=A0A0K8UYP0_BACLA